ncbi:hypothetical protein F7725_009351 [Dissostichus mawsoni]|uniref:Uncharacterized protein n=1 Tax=Dissostichus mawsoni TaxID=36200 RepID=A0A7J5Z6S0_DISMA|nr:hypothetical protein F7725_009351 [Dissostichus mawsoni]
MTENGNATILGNNLNQLLSSARDTFPNAAIYTELSPRTIRNIRFLNKLIGKTSGHVKTLRAEDFNTERDHIHWTSSTARKILDHWKYSLGLGHL